MVPCDRAMRSISRLGRLTDWGDIPCDRVPGPDTTVRTASGANQKSADIPVLQHKQPLSTADTSGCRYTDPYSVLNNSVQAFYSGCARRMSNHWHICFPLQSQVFHITILIVRSAPWCAKAGNIADTRIVLSEDQTSGYILRV